jgi:SecD/SecF fusion protein
MRRSSFVAIANQSVWETIRRSIATSVITLLPVVSLLIFGGDTLKDFAFALLVGIGIGAISTIFIATPFLTVIMERTPEFAKRKGADAPGEKLLEPIAEPAAATAAGRLAQRLRRPVPAVVGGGGAGDEEPVSAAATETDELALPDEPAAADMPEPEAPPVEEPTPVQEAPASAQDAAARRDARRKRRRTRPHGRAR